MIDPVKELKLRAERLQRDVTSPTLATRTSALERLRVLPEHAKATAESLLAAAEHIQRKHCLAIVARESGFESWTHASAVLEGKEVDAQLGFGTLLNRPGMSAHWNIWSAHYDEARSIRSENGGYLLAYKRHFFIVDRYYIEALGLDPDDTDWASIGRDWVKPHDPAARRRLYAKLLAHHA